MESTRATCDDRGTCTSFSLVRLLTSEPQKNSLEISEKKKKHVRTKTKILLLYRMNNPIRLRYTTNIRGKKEEKKKSEIPTILG